MATWIALALGCASTVLLFVTFRALDRTSDMLNPSFPTPGSQLGGGFGYPLYCQGIIQVFNETYVGLSLPFTVEAPRFGSTLVPIEGELRVIEEPGSKQDHEDERSNRNNSQACNVLETDLTDSIALVKTGGCSLAVKLLNCQAAGARAVIVDSDLARDSELIFKNAEIPGMSVSSSTLESLVDSAGNVAALWSLPPALNFSTIDVLILLIVRPLILFLIVCVIFFVNLSCTESRRTASPRVVSALPTHIYSCSNNCITAAGMWNQEGCRICLDDFINGCEVMTLPCGHEFHSACVSVWLLKQREVCPLCKMIVDRERIPLLV